MTSVSAVIVSHDRADSLRLVLERIADLSLDEIIVVDNGSSDASPQVATNWGRNVALLAMSTNIGVAARNLGVQRARGDLILMLDDDSYPLPGALEVLVAACRRDPRVGVAGGRVIDVDGRGERVGDGTGPGSFDWFFRSSDGPASPEVGVPACFFAQCACVVRRRAFLEVGGCFEPYFFYGEELDLTARMVAAGWNVTYHRDATFEHRRNRSGGRTSPAIRRMLRYRIRNQLWYFWLRFPLSVSVRRIPAYLAYDLIECVYRGEVSSWLCGVRQAWSQRALISGQRQPLPREALRRHERDRGRRHLRLVGLMARERLTHTTEAR